MNNIVHVYVVNVPNLKICKIVISFFFNLFHQKMEIFIYWLTSLHETLYQKCMCDKQLTKVTISGSIFSYST